MVANFGTPQDHCRDMVDRLQSSNLHYFVQETPFSVYITVRKRFKKVNQISQSSGSPAETTSEIVSKNAYTELENKLRLKELECEKAEDAFKVLQNQLKVEVEEKERTIDTLEKKLEAAEAEMYRAYEKVKEERAQVSADMNFLRNSAKQSSEEAFSMEWKLSVASKKMTKKEKENEVLNEKVKILKEKNNKLEKEFEIMEIDNSNLKTKCEDKKEAPIFELPQVQPKLSDPQYFPLITSPRNTSKDLNSNTLFPPLCPMLRAAQPASRSSQDSVQVVVQDSRTNNTKNASDLDPGGSKSRTFP